MTNLTIPLDPLALHTLVRIQDALHADPAHHSELARNSPTLHLLDDTIRTRRQAKRATARNYARNPGEGKSPHGPPITHLDPPQTTYPHRLLPGDTT